MTDKPNKQKRNRTKKIVVTEKHTKQIELYTKKVPVAEIAKLTDSSVPAVYDTIRIFGGIFKELENVGRYRDKKRDLLDAAELAILKKAMQAEKLDQASLSNLAYAFRIFFESNRLESGKSTANIEQHVKFATININDLKKD